ncbi:MAG: 5-(carboxyamino)imidazole ribonucleotide synthase [Neptuniibacter caesariensis]|uniref:N5-carboxyaminoimidazole ribonucleotide synthase n=1 Tax=Neptuniibacter caesariensis TaxID=207954 RepID=A0A2G6JBB9_NEPCE|nr:MAG: 5-(carboxyamino)imidazole ribonucleotide synthase [Neptuniibacter caesariensis]
MHVAIVGCGQLARMMALAGWPMGHRFTFLADPGESFICVEGLGRVVELEPELNGRALYEALGKPDVVTVEREHVNAARLSTLKPYCAVHPDPEAIKYCQHRGREKTFLNSLGIQTAPFHVANNAEALFAGVKALGFPVFVKTCEEGYDGYGQWVLKCDEDLNKLLAEADSLPEVVIEGRIEFERELSLIAARNASGDCVFYPMTENHHRNGILWNSIAPAKAPDTLHAKAKKIADKILNATEYVGVIAIEMFHSGDDLIVNELAPRVHNSGHWTQGAGICSQFENHIRAICDYGLGITISSQHAGMVNLLGIEAPKAIVSESNVQHHVYNKSLRPGRKVGHLNLVSADRAELEAQLQRICNSLYPG